MFEKVDQEAHDQFYAEVGRTAFGKLDVEQYREAFERTELSPYHLGGNTKGFVRGLATQRLCEAADALGRPRAEITVLDAGCGEGRLSTYLACLGFNTIGVDVSSVACKQAAELAAETGVGERCRFLPESLESLSLPDNSVDLVAGHAALHHFIKYEGVPSELYRVLRPTGQGFFADSFGENKFYSLFHDKAKMKRLGDVSLTKPLVVSYFEPFFDVTLTPTDWFTMLDKLWPKLKPSAKPSSLYRISKMARAADDRMPRGRVALAASGAVATTVVSRKQ